MNEPRRPLLRVECYAGYRAEEEPRSFSLGRQTITVEAIDDRWLAPELRYFKVRGNDGGTYLLRHHTSDDHWELVMYDSGRHNGSRLSSPDAS